MGASFHRAPAVQLVLFRRCAQWSALHQCLFSIRCARVCDIPSLHCQCVTSCLANPSPAPSFPDIVKPLLCLILFLPLFTLLLRQLCTACSCSDIDQPVIILYLPPPPLPPSPGAQLSTPGSRPRRSGASSFIFGLLFSFLFLFLFLLQAPNLARPVHVHVVAAQVAFESKA
jgi:hypothetical protein